MSAHKLSTRRTSCSPRPVLVCSLLLATGSGFAEADGLTWVIAPYVWGSDVSLDLAINNDPVLGSEASFSDLLDKLETAFMGRVEVRGERFGGLFDVIYIDLSDGQTVPVGSGGPILGDLVFDTSLELQVYEFGVFYRFLAQDPTRANFDLLLGAREMDADARANITLPGPGATPIERRVANSETDIFAGARVIGKFNDRWGYKARIDYGAGGSEGAVNALAAVGYTFGDKGLFTLDLGYRYFSVELEKSLGETVAGEVFADTDITMAGPVLGFIFEF